MKILLVCLGNICRSPIAEGVLKHKALQHGLDWEIDSAGTEAYHVGEAPQPFSQKVCRENGIDISGQRSRQLKPADFSKFDLIYAMARDVRTEMNAIAPPHTSMNNVSLFLNELYPGSNESVPDPYGGTEADYQRVFEMVSLTCDAIIRKYKTI